MEISKNWAQEERQHVALNLTIQARNKIGHVPLPSDNQAFVWECLDTIGFLLSAGKEWLEANRVQILEHYKE